VQEAKRLTGGQGSKRGTPQGGVISPLLANIYMNRFLKYWRQNGLGQRLKAHVVVYADDLVSSLADRRARRTRC